MPNSRMQHEPALDHADWPPALEIVNQAGRSPIVLICEHASNHMPAEYGGLGLGPVDLSRHIAWDVGAAEVTRHLARLLDAPAFLAGYSRLLIDLNRPLGAASSIPLVSEATEIPGADAVIDMPASEILDGRPHGLEALQAVDHHREHLHQLPSLLGHVGREEVAQGGIELEEPVVEDHRRLIGDRGNHREGRLYQRYLRRVHYRFLLSVLRLSIEGRRPVT